jgi:hypothetical protein
MSSDDEDGGSERHENESVVRVIGGDRSGDRYGTIRVQCSSEYTGMLRTDPGGDFFLFHAELVCGARTQAPQRRSTAAANLIQDPVVCGGEPSVNSVIRCRVLTQHLVQQNSRVLMGDPIQR